MALTDNLQAYYKLDESSGNASDSSGNGYTLTNNNTVGYSSAKINNGADFGSTNTNKSLTTTSDLAIGGGAITMSMWVKVLAEPGTNVTYNLCNHGDAGNFVTHGLMYRDESGVKKLAFERGKGGVANNIFTSNQTLGTSNYYHIVYHYDGSTITGYLNDTSIGTVASTGNGTSGVVDGFNLAVARELNTNYSSVIIDEVGVWARALSSAEITELYNGGNGLTHPFTGTTNTTNFFAMM